MQPTVAIKNALQEGRALPRAPRELYRGLLVSFPQGGRDVGVLPFSHQRHCSCALFVAGLRRSTLVPCCPSPPLSLG